MLSQHPKYPRADAHVQRPQEAQVEDEEAQAQEAQEAHTRSP